MFQSGNHQFLKSLNRKHILNLLRMHQGLSARSLSQMTGLKTATVLNILKELEAEKQINRKEKGTSTIKGGKRPALWDINPHYGKAIGVEWLSTQIRLALIDFNLQVLSKEIIHFANQTSDRQKVAFFRDRLKRFMTRHGVKTQQILGLGIGLAGVVDFEGGLVLSSYSFSQRSFPLKAMLSAGLPFPVYLDNESNMGALGLKWMMPELFQARNIIYLTIHQCFSGMGAGFIFGHQLYRGKQNATGEWPGALFDDRFLSSLIQKLESPDHTLTRLLREKATLKEVFDLAQHLTEKDDPLARRFWQLLLEPLVPRLELLVSLLDPDIVVVGGDIFDLRPELAAVLQSRMEQIVGGERFQRPEVMCSPFGTYTNALGAAVTVLSEVYQR